MKRKNSSFSISAGLVVAVLLAMPFAGCANKTTPSIEATKADASKTAVSIPKGEIAKAEIPVTVRPTIRVKAGLDSELKDTKGNTWAADTGFDGGETVDRPDIKIVGTDVPELYHSEHYGMNSYSAKVPNGEYNISLHYSEDYDGITDASQRVFTYAVIDGDPATGKTVKEVKDFSPWKAAGEQYKAYVDTVPVTVTNGEISVKFTPQVENPQINAIEISPR